MSLLDRLYARWANRRPFFSEGWGAPVAGWPSLAAQVPDLEWRGRRGRFVSPLPGLPSECAHAHVEWWMPRGSGRDTPICLHFAATGDEGFLRRRLVVWPLLRQGIGSVILENPFYGVRRPAGQAGTRLRRFSDLWSMGTATVAEGLALLAWLSAAGYRRLGVAGVSMGGQMAALVASLWGRPVAMAACASPHSAEVVFTRGAMRIGCDWQALGGAVSALPRMRSLLDATDLRAFPRLASPESAVLVAGRADAYVPPWSAELLHHTWPGSTLRWLPTGHVGVVLFYPGAYRRAIADAFAALRT